MQQAVPRPRGRGCETGGPKSETRISKPKTTPKQNQKAETRQEDPAFRAKRGQKRFGFGIGVSVCFKSRASDSTVLVIGTWSLVIQASRCLAPGAYQHLLDADQGGCYPRPDRSSAPEPLATHHSRDRGQCKYGSLFRLILANHAANQTSDKTAEHHHPCAKEDRHGRWARPRGRRRANRGQGCNDRPAEHSELESLSGKPPWRKNVVETQVPKECVE